MWTQRLVWLVTRLYTDACYLLDTEMRMPALGKIVRLSTIGGPERGVQPRRHPHRDTGWLHIPWLILVTSVSSPCL